MIRAEGGAERWVVSCFPPLNFVVFCHLDHPLHSVLLLCESECSVRRILETGARRSTFIPEALTALPELSLSALETEACGGRSTLPVALA